MVLLDLLRRAPLAFLAVAHCNFSLRGAESDRETALVERVCAERAIPCFVRQFDTKAECLATGESTQMAARRLRYDFFDELLTIHALDKVAVAHHADDSVETFFVNLTRGTGLRGLTGISVARERIVRPLLSFSREQIETYAVQNAVEYLNDSSNATLDYLRNRLRHDIIPRLDHSAPAFFGAMARTMGHLDSAQQFIDNQIRSIKKSAFLGGVLDLSTLRSHPSFEFVLFEILHPYGFSGSVVGDILASETSGKEFFSPTHRAVLDRDRLIINERSVLSFVDRTFERNDSAIEWLTVDEIFSLETPPNVALLSADAMQFPLTLRKWQAGDWFVPLGLKGQKKVSDFLIDAKISIPDKERQGVLISGSDTIVWLAGRRIDDRFKVTEQSRSVIRLTL